MNPMLILASHSILDASKGVDFGQFIQAILSVICLLIDSVVYYVVSIAFKLFLAISQFQIFSDSAFNDLINRTYVVIGVISLFLVAYALLNAIIDPDNASKGDKSVSKIVKNIIIAIIGIAIVPTVFNWFYEFQSRVLCNNTIPKILLNKVDSDGSTVENTATQFAAYLFESFFYPNSTSSVDGDAVDKSTALKNVKLNIEDPIPAAERNFDVTEYTLDVAYKHAEEGKSFFRVFRPFIFGNWFDNSIVNNTVQYLVILSTIAGGYCAYVLISLCIDMGLRAVKLGYLELIAPLAIMTKIVPGKDSVFKNWSKKTVSCALEVFVRLFIVVFVIYLINTIKDIELVSLGSKICGLKIGWFLVGILRALIYTSLFAFIKKAPKFFSEATGIKSDGFKIGLMDKMKENGMIQGLGAIGGGITAGVRNMAPGVAKGFANGGVLGAIGGGIKSLPSGLAGAASGTRRGWSNTKDVKKWSDVKEGAGKAADEAMEAKFKRQDYKDSHGGTFWGTAGGHAKDAISSLGDWVNAPEATYKHAKAIHDTVSNVDTKEKALKDFAKEQRSKEENKFKFTDKTGVTLAARENDTALAQKDVDKAMEEQIAAAKAVGDDENYSAEGIAKKRIAADRELVAANSALQAARTEDERRIANERLQTAMVRQAAAYALREDISKTTAGVELRKKAAEDALRTARDNLKTATEKQAAAEKYIDENIVNGTETFINELSDGAKTKFDNLTKDYRSAVKEAQSYTNNDSRVSDYLNGENNDTANATNVAKVFKAIDNELVGKINEYGDAIRKKSEGKK